MGALIGPRGHERTCAAKRKLGSWLAVLAFAGVSASHAQAQVCSNGTYRTFGALASQTGTSQALVNGNNIYVDSSQLQLSHQQVGDAVITTNDISDSHYAGEPGIRIGHTRTASTSSDRIDTTLSFRVPGSTTIFQPVSNLTFRLHDVDAYDNVIVNAYDQNGTLINLTGSGIYSFDSSDGTPYPSYAGSNRFTTDFGDSPNGERRGTINFNFGSRQIRQVVFRYYDTNAAGTYTIAELMGCSVPVRVYKVTNGSTGGPFGFTLTNTARDTGATVSTTTAGTPVQVDGNNAVAGAQPFMVTTPGTAVTINESSLPPGWTLVNASCTNAANASVGSRSGTTYTIPAANTAAGQALSCTFTNTRTSLRVQKALPGGRIQSGDQFTLRIGSGASILQTATTMGTTSNPTQSATLSPATAGTAYTLSEVAAGTTVLGNYASTYSCTNTRAGGQTLSGSGTTFNITPAAGDDLTCTFTNVIRPRVTIRKTSVGGTGSFTFSGSNGIADQTIATATPGTPVAGAVQMLTTVGQATTITEGAPPAGFALTDIACTGVPAGSTTVNLATRTVTLSAAATAAGTNATCTFTNTRPTQLTLRKTVTNNNGGTQLPTAWTLSAAGPTNISGTTGAAAVTNATVNPGAYTLTESATPTGYTASSYSCVKNGGAAVSGNSITLAAGDTATCTINNDDRPATLTLRKTVTNDNGGTQLPTAWTLSAAGPTAISGATGSAAVTNATVNPGTYTLSESATPTGYTASSYSCVKNSGAAVVGNNITLAAGDAATCTINNNDSDQTDVSITKVASADTVVRGDEVVFTLVVRNPGVAAAPGTVVRDPAMAGLDCTAAGLAVPTCSATGGASCPTPLTASGLQAGVAIPALPAGSTVSIDLTCRATASGMP
ncbi:hypothetical protein [Pseudoxanthomonas sp.]|uniref:prealbumin-like fold domain-containing protein n=1 Tax=Pseudoxanthomonas sp. TaxID=1871049 RepID=UPI0028C44AE2|nr:hypothetical protein [Pseudoxanthomonas sp.]